MNKSEERGRDVGLQVVQLGERDTQDVRDLRGAQVEERQLWTSSTMKR